MSQNKNTPPMNPNIPERGNAQRPGTDPKSGTDFNKSNQDSRFGNDSRQRSSNQTDDQTREANPSITKHPNQAAREPLASDTSGQYSADQSNRRNKGSTNATSGQDTNLPEADGYNEIDEDTDDSALGQGPGGTGTSGRADGSRPSGSTSPDRSKHNQQSSDRNERSSGSGNR